MLNSNIEIPNKPAESNPIRKSETYSFGASAFDSLDLFRNSDFEFRKAELLIS
jgi:hypothetical protein